MISLESPSTQGKRSSNHVQPAPASPNPSPFPLPCFPARVLFPRALRRDPAFRSARRPESAGNGWARPGQRLPTEQAPSHLPRRPAPAHLSSAGAAPVRSVRRGESGESSKAWADPALTFRQAAQQKQQPSLRAAAYPRSGPPPPVPGAPLLRIETSPLLAGPDSRR